MSQNDREQRIMALHDDELEPELRAAVRAEVEHDRRAQGELVSLELVGELVREVHARRAPDVDLSDAILARVQAQRSVARIAQPVPPRAARWERFAPAGAVLALAAMIALFVTSYRSTEREPARVTLVPAAPTAAPGPMVARVDNLPNEASEAGVSIQSVDFGATQGAIFMVSSGESETMVVWTLEEGNDKG